MKSFTMYNIMCFQKFKHLSQLSHVSVFDYTSHVKVVKKNHYKAVKRILK